MTSNIVNQATPNSNNTNSNISTVAQQAFSTSQLTQPINKPAMNLTDIDKNSEKLDKEDKKVNVKKGRVKLEFKKSRQPVNDLIEELLINKIPVGLLENGYAIGGFYMQNGNGICEVYEQDDGSLVGLDYHGKPFEIKELSDLVIANGKAYEFYKKHEKINLYENCWFNLLMQQFDMVSNLVAK